MQPQSRQRGAPPGLKAAREFRDDSVICAVGREIVVFEGVFLKIVKLPHRLAIGAR